MRPPLCSCRAPPRRAARGAVFLSARNSRKRGAPGSEGSNLKRRRASAIPRNPVFPRLCRPRQIPTDFTPKVSGGRLSRGRNPAAPAVLDRTWPGRLPGKPGASGHFHRMRKRPLRAQSRMRKLKSWDGAAIGGRPRSGCLYGSPPYAKGESSRKFSLPKPSPAARAGDRFGKPQACGAETVPSSTFTPGPIVELMAMRWI